MRTKMKSHFFAIVIVFPFPFFRFSKKALAKGSDLGVPQKIYLHNDGTMREDVQFVIAKARNYVRTMGKDSEDASCRNQHEECSYWAFRGECEANMKCEYIVLVYGFFFFLFFSHFRRCSCIFRDERELRTGLPGLLVSAPHRSTWRRSRNERR